MKYPSVFLVLIFLAVAGTPCLAEPPVDSAAAAPVLRKPFTLRLKLDDDHYYEEKFTRDIPYVQHNSVYLFAGESFGLKLDVANGQVISIAYIKQPAGADVELEFSQFIAKDGLAMMMLKIKNNLKQTLYLDASMTNPGDKNVYKTAIRPVRAGQVSYESWAQPIIELKLANLRLKPQFSY